MHKDEINFKLYDEQNEIIQKLINIGLTYEESVIYFYLSIAGPSSASEVAKYTKKSRLRTYRLLKKLENKSIIEATMERPMRFIPLPIKNVIDILSGELEKKIQIIDSNKKELLDVWSHLETIEHDKYQREERFKIIQDRNTINAFIDVMFNGSKKDIVIVADKQFIYRFNEFRDLVVKAKKRGITIKLMTEFNEANKYYIENLMDVCDIYHSNIELNTTFIIIDKSELLLFLITDTTLHQLGKNETVLWTNSQAIINMEMQFFDLLNKISIDAATELIYMDIEKKKSLSIELKLNNKKSYDSLYELIQFSMLNFDIKSLKLNIYDIADVITKNIAYNLTKDYKTKNVEELLSTMSNLWTKNKFGILKIVNKKPLEIEVSQCNSCIPIEGIGEIFCTRLLSNIINIKLGVTCNIILKKQEVGKACIFTEKGIND